MRKQLLFLVLVLLAMTLSGCGVDWFPAPDPVVSDFTFKAAGTDVNGGTIQTSDAVTLTVTGGAAKISVSGDPTSEYSINGGAFTTAAGTVKDGDKVTVHHKAADNTTGSAKGVVSTTLRVGNKSATFTTTTASTSAVTAFTFSSAKVQAGKSTAQVSPAIKVVITGAVAAVTVSGDASSEYSINSGAFTKTPGTVASGDTVIVRHTSASTDDTTVATTLKIGDKTDSFFSTTGAVVSETIDVSGTADKNVFAPVALHLVPGEYTIHIVSGFGGFSTTATATTLETADITYPGMPDEIVNLVDKQVIYVVDLAPLATDPKSTTVITISNGTSTGTLTYNVSGKP